MGRHLVEALLREGVRVGSLSRGGLADGLAGVRWHRADLENPATLEKIADDYDAVVHLAGLAHQKATEDDYRRRNVDGTRHLLDAIRGTSVRTFLYLSSVKAAAESSDGPLHEEDPPTPEDAYGRSKLAAERVVLGECPPGMRAIILRPPMVYGPGNQGNLPRLLRLVERGLPLPLGGVRNRRSIIYVGNLVAAMLCALRCPAADRKVFYVSDGPPVSTPTLIRALARSSGYRVRLIPVPIPLLRAVARVGDLVAGFLGPSIERPGQVVRKLTSDLEIDTSRFRRTCGFEPPVSLDVALAETVRASPIGPFPLNQPLDI